MLSKNITFYQPRLFKPFKKLLGIESRRQGGTSPKPYQSMNLGLNTNDLCKNVAENRKRFFHALDFSKNQTAGSRQIHGTEVLKVVQPGQYEGYDALITQQKNLFLLVTIADCTPVLIYDPVQGAVAAIHAGWRGTAGQIVVKTLKKMNQCFGTDPSDCLAYVGTCIDECSFEVDVDVAQHFATQHQRWDESSQKYFIHLKQANKDQLLQCGVPETQIEVSPFSTVLDEEHYFSYRRDGGETGRMLGVVGMREA